MNESCPICNVEFKEYTMDGLRRSAICASNNPYQHCLEKEWWMFYYGGTHPKFVEIKVTVFVKVGNIELYFKDSEIQYYCIIDGAEKYIIDKIDIFNWQNIPNIIKTVINNVAFL